MRTLLALLAITALCGQAKAFEWGHYSNARYGYVIDVPPEFTPVAESDNGDGGFSDAPDKLSRLAVWGSNLVEGSFAQDFADRLAAAKADGWEISYSRETANWASWSGSQQGRIFYARAVRLCDDQIAYFLFEYPRARLESYKPFVAGLVRSLKNARRC